MDFSLKVADEQGNVTDLATLGVNAGKALPGTELIDRGDVPLSDRVISDLLLDAKNADELQDNILLLSDNIGSASDVDDLVDALTLPTLLANATKINFYGDFGALYEQQGEEDIFPEMGEADIELWSNHINIAKLAEEVYGNMPGIVALQSGRVADTRGI